MTEVVQTRVIDNGIQTLSSVAVIKNHRIVYSCFFIERPWKNNQRNISCIPLGEYDVIKQTAKDSGKFKYPHFKVLNVKDRTYIKWHVANHYYDLHGCMGPGKYAKHDIDKDGQIDVTDSTRTLKALVRYLPSRFKLTIIEKPDLRKAV